MLSRRPGLVNFAVYIAVTWTCGEEGNDYTKCTFLRLLSEGLDSARRREPFLVRIPQESSGRAITCRLWI